MALIAAHLAKVTLEHTTHNPVAAHIGKESIRQVGRRARRTTLKAAHPAKGQHSSIRSSKGFNPRAARVSSPRSARASTTQTMSFASRGYGGHGGGSMGGFAAGGFHGK